MSGISISKCLRRLKNAKNDTEKFAALLMITKITNSEDCGSEVRAEVFDAIGFTFIRRLLKTKVEEGPDGVADKSYQHLAVNLLSSFCSVERIVTSPDMLKTLPSLNEILLMFEKCPDEAANAQMLDDCYQCLTCIANRSEGRDAIITYRSTATLCTVVIRDLYGSDKALALLRYLLHHCGSKYWTNNIDGLHELLSTMCGKYEEQKDQSKFNTGQLLTEILSSVTMEQVHNHQHWQESIHKTLFSVLRNKLGSEQRNATISLASVVVNLLGVGWVLEPCKTTQAMDEIVNNRKSLLLMVHLVCIEVRMLLEDKTFIQVNEQSNFLCRCYDLLENIIGHMSTEPSLGLDEKQTGQLYTAMIGAFGAVIHFLDEVRLQCEDQMLAAVTLASLRVLGAWIAEETTALQKDVVQILPFLLRVGKETFEIRKNLTEYKGQSANENAMQVDLPNRPEFPVTDVLKFILPGLSHLTTEESPRKVFFEEDGHTLLAEYFSYLVKNISSQDEESEVEGCLLTVCGVFLNLAVLEPDRVAEDVAFNDILQYIIHNIHHLGVDKHLVFIFNLAVLGLMIIRHKTAKHGRNAVEQCGQFFNTVRRLVSKAHVCNNDSGTYRIALSEDYADEWQNISELWFLSMQSLGSCLSLLPWLSTMILKSGWIPSILTTLWNTKDDKADIEVLVSYKVLLCEIATTSEAAKKLIKEKRGLEVARAYNMKELEDIIR